MAQVDGKNEWMAEHLPCKCKALSSNPRASEEEGGGGREIHRLGQPGQEGTSSSGDQSLKMDHSGEGAWGSRAVPRTQGLTLGLQVVQQRLGVVQGAGGQAANAVLSQAAGGAQQWVPVLGCAVGMGHGPDQGQGCYTLHYVLWEVMASEEQPGRLGGPPASPLWVRPRDKGHRGEVARSNYVPGAETHGDVTLRVFLVVCTALQVWNCSGKGMSQSSSLELSFWMRPPGVRFWLGHVPVVWAWERI
jgi:hypothetical protein